MPSNLSRPSTISMLGKGLASQRPMLSERRDSGTFDFSVLTVSPKNCEIQCRLHPLAAPRFLDCQSGVYSSASHLLPNRDPLWTDRHLGLDNSGLGRVLQGRGRGSNNGYQRCLRAPKVAKSGSPLRRSECETARANYLIIERSQIIIDRPTGPSLDV